MLERSNRERRQAIELVVTNAMKGGDLDVVKRLLNSEPCVRVSVNEFLREFWYELRSRTDRVRLRMMLHLGDDAQVRVGVGWLRHALNILVDNAVRELEHVPERNQELSLISRSTRSGVEIVVADNCPGIPPYIRALFGKTSVPGAMEPISGYLTAKAVAEIYGGKLEVETGSWGTQMIIGLPAYKELPDAG